MIITHASLIPTESAEAEWLAQYLLLLQRTGKILLYSHIPHETYTKSWNARRKNTREGVRSGVPDYIIVTRTSVLFIELKRIKGGYVNKEQQEWLLALNDKKTRTFVARGFEQAKKYLDEQLASE